MPAITPFLWFNDTAEEAANFYVSIFPNSKIVRASRYGEAGPGPKELPFHSCYYWDKLTAGGKAVQCGWLEDKYGLSWQIVPKERSRSA
jgi:predicted 3-demethylubiquinone-9 3-methyltransferase (glyoxalase superfamily)